MKRSRITSQTVDWVDEAHEPNSPLGLGRASGRHATINFGEHSNFQRKHSRQKPTATENKQMHSVRTFEFDSDFGLSSEWKH
jgi:hypothetical protein